MQAPHNSMVILNIKNNDKNSVANLEDIIHYEMFYFISMAWNLFLIQENKFHF